MKKKICVIFTGGTIGSADDGKYLSLSGTSKKLLIEKYYAMCGNDISFDDLSPINILSENVQPDDLEKMYACLKSVDPSKYDGIIITHGTDTLCFTVNWFSQVFCAYPLPIVFVSALYPLSDKRSNGVKNFAGAVKFIEEARLNGVYCSFTNSEENCKIHLGTRLVYPDEITGSYHSALGEHFAEIKDGKLVFNNSPLVPTAEEVRNNKCENLTPALSDEVMLITMRSLLNFSVYDFTDVRPRAVIVEPSHSGTICTEGQSLNFLKFADYCKECGVEVIFAPVMSKAGVYASMKNVPKTVKIAYDMTVEMTIVKVMAALGENLPADTYFNDNRFFEKVPLGVKK